MPIICAQGNSSGKVALHNACWAGKTATVQVLLDAGASVNALTIRGQTPLHFACSRANSKKAQCLLAHHSHGGDDENPKQRRAKLKIKSVMGETPLSLAVDIPLDTELLDALRARQQTEWDGWVDFQQTIRARPLRREAMLRYGTLIFSGPKQEATLTAASKSGALPDLNRPGAAHEDCCALMVCNCRKKQDKPARPFPGSPGYLKFKQMSQPTHFGQHDTGEPASNEPTEVSL